MGLTQRKGLALGASGSPPAGPSDTTVDGRSRLGQTGLIEHLRTVERNLALHLFPGLTRFGRFGLVGASGLVVNTLLLAFCTEAVGLYYMLSLVLATQGSSLWNFCLSELWVFDRPATRGHRLRRGALFLAMNNVALFARAPMVFLLTSFVGMNYLLSNVSSMAVLLLIRYVIADSLIWRPRPLDADVTSASLPIAPQGHEASS